MAEFKLRPSETILEDDYPLYCNFIYIVDNIFVKMNFHGYVKEYKQRYNVNEIRRCDIFDHEGARIGDLCK